MSAVLEMPRLTEAAEAAKLHVIAHDVPLFAPWAIRAMAALYLHQLETGE